jgi:hypothetical protein
MLKAHCSMVNPQKLNAHGTIRLRECERLHPGIASLGITHSALGIGH